MDALAQFVGSYRGRDKLMRLCQYAARFLAGTAHTGLEVKFNIIAQEFGKCRAAFRLFDDIPLLAYTLHYGLGKKESNGWMRFLTLLANCANQLYFPLEHLSWFAQNKIIDMSHTKWAIACTVAWATALVTEILKAISRINQIRKDQRRLLKEQQLEAQDERDPTEMSTNIRKQIRALKAQEVDNYLSIIENSADFTNAINWLPGGFLWSGKFSLKYNGAIGIISSAMKLCRMHGAK